MLPLAVASGVSASRVSASNPRSSTFTGGADQGVGERGSSRCKAFRLIEALGRTMILHSVKLIMRTYYILGFLTVCYGIRTSPQSSPLLMIHCFSGSQGIITPAGDKSYFTGSGIIEQIGFLIVIYCNISSLHARAIQANMPEKDVVIIRKRQAKKRHMNRKKKEGTAISILSSNLTSQHFAPPRLAEG